MQNIIVSSQNAEGVASDFLFYLAAPIYLDRNLVYEAGLVEIHLPVAWFNVDEPYCFHLSDAEGELEALVLQPGRFARAEELVGCLNELLAVSGMLFYDARSEREMEAADESGLIDSAGKEFGIRFEIIDAKINIQNRTAHIELLLPQHEILQWMGLGRQAVTVGPGGHHVAEFYIGCAPCSLLHVHSNIIESSSCNENSLLRTINMDPETKWGDYHSEVFKKVLFHSLQRVNFLVSFRVQLRDIFGKVLKPQTGAPVLLTVQIREKKLE